MEIGIFILVNLTLACKPSPANLWAANILITTDLKNLPSTGSPHCNILSESLCLTYTKDPYTIVLTMFACLQLTWVTMLILVQLLQVARAQTTFENMRGHTHHLTRGGPEFITSALVAGTTSLEGAQVTPAGMGPDPALVSDSSHRGEGQQGRHHGPRREGFLSQWKRLLGLDTFMATAQAGLSSGTGAGHQSRNPFSRGMVTNCKDFWCDTEPIFGKRQTGSAMLGGQAVDYTKMYDTPPRMRHPMTMQPHDGGRYQSVAVDDVV